MVDSTPGTANPSIDITLRKLEGPAVGQQVIQEIESAKGFLDEKKYDDAIKAFNGILEKYKEESGIDIVYLYIGNCFAMKGEYAQAVEFFKKSLEKFPKNKEIILSIGNAYNNMSDQENALAWFSKLSIDEIGNVDTLYNIGVIYYNSGDMVGAARYFQKSVDVDPSFADGFYQLGMTLAGIEERQQDSVAALEKFVQLAPDSPNVETAKAVIEAYKAQK